MGKLKNSLWNWRIKIYSRFIYHHACFLHPAGAMKILGNEWPKWGSVVPLGVDLSFLTSNYTVPASMGNDKLVRFLYLGGISKMRQGKTWSEIAVMYEQKVYYPLLNNSFD